MLVSPQTFGLIIFFLTALLSGPVAAFDALQLTKDDERNLLAGNAVVVVKPAGDSSVAIAAAIEVPTRPEIVWSVLTDCDRAPDYVPYLKSCRILKKSADGREDIREIIGQGMWLLPRLRSVFRSGYDEQKRVRFKTIAGDITELSGEWRLDPVHKHRATRLTYEAKAGTPVLIPSSFMRGAIEADVAKVLRAVRNEAIKSGRG